MPKRTADSVHGFLPELALAPSRLYHGWLLVLFTLGVAVALFSHHPLPVKGGLLAGLALLLLAAVWHERRRGLRELSLGEGGRVAWSGADGRLHTGSCAGYALLGSLVIFVYVHRAGWRRLLGPMRLTVLRDATDPDAFRRLRARVRLTH